MLRYFHYHIQVVEGYTNDLIDLYHYKNWMREPSVNAIIELLSSLDPESNPTLIAQVTNNVIIPKLFRYDDSNENQKQWLQSLTPEMIAVILFLQTPRKVNMKLDSPLDNPLVAAESLPSISAALASTSNVLHPRRHIVWNTLWMYLTEEGEANGHRRLRANDESLSIVDKIMQHVVVDLLLGKAENNTTPTHERRSLALQIVCALSEISPSSHIAQVLRPEVISAVFLNVLCASGGVGKKASKKGGVEHYLKPLTLTALADMINHCCEEDSADRRLAFAKSFLSSEPRFDSKTKTHTVCSLLMLETGGDELSKENETIRESLWYQYLSFLEESIISSTSLHLATVHIELMHNLAKRDLTIASANVARRVVRFFMSGAFFDCSGLVDPSFDTKGSTKKRKKDKAKAATMSPPQELSSGLRIKEILKENGIESVSYDVRAILSARFYSLLSDITSVINAQNHGVTEGKSFHGKASRPEAIYRLLSEIYGTFSLLETSGAKQYPFRSANCNDDDNNNDFDGNDPNEESRKYVDQVQNITNKSLIKDCNGSGDDFFLRAKALFATSCASLMISLKLQLNGCGTPDLHDEDEDEEAEEVIQTVHEHISDLSDCVVGFNRMIDGKSLEVNGEQENPLAVFAGLAVNILSSPVGGEDFEKTNPIQASASKLTRETIKLAWSGIISASTELNVKNKSFNCLVDEDVMNVLIESVCGEKSMGDDREEDETSMADSSSPENELGESAVFVNASEVGVNIDDAIGTGSDDSDECSDDEDGGDVELDPTKLEKLLLEDSDAEMEETDILEHHAGADKALARLIKMKQEARKASQAERERIVLCNRLRCASLLDILFAPSVLKSGWLPIEAVLGSIVPILRAYKALLKGIQSSSSANAMKSLSEKNALADRLSALVKNKLSKYRSSDASNVEELALKASTSIVEEMTRSLNAAHCSCCSVALITAVRCFPNVEESQSVKELYVSVINDWSSRKATKIHSCVFDDVIKRMPRYVMMRACLIGLFPYVASTNDCVFPLLQSCFIDID
jgi:hypothetical protein